MKSVSLLINEANSSKILLGHVAVPAQINNEIVNIV
jgi:hypothetical protein